jgi:hypothetical protein
VRNINEKLFFSQAKSHKSSREIVHRHSAYALSDITAFNPRCKKGFQIALQEKIPSALQKIIGITSFKPPAKFQRRDPALLRLLA